MHIPLIIEAAIVGLVVILVGFRIAALEAFIWLAAAIVGQASALELIDAGPSVHYQHFRSLTILLNGEFKLPVAFLTVLAISVGIRLFHRRTLVAAILSPATGLLRTWQWCALALLLVTTSATVSRDPRFYAQELVFASTVQLVSFATIILFALAVPANITRCTRIWFRRVFGDGGNPAVRRWGLVDPFAIGGAVCVTGVAIILVTLVYQRHPHIPDEVGYLYHARYFAGGMLTMPAPPVREAFDVDLFTYEPDRWYSPVPPGWPAVLALGTWAGVPWLVNPILAGINVILSSLLLERLYDRRTARIACLFLCLSPWHVFMAMNFMTHQLAFTCLLVAAIAVQKMRETGNAWFGIPGGIATAFITLIRPLEGVAIAFAMGLWALGARRRRFPLAPAIVLTLVTVGVASTQFAYNASLTGSPRIFPLMKYFDETYRPGVNALGFGPDRGLNWPLDPFPGHGLRDVLVNANLNLTATNVELFGWSIGSLLPMGLFMVSQGMRRADYHLLALIVVTVGIHSLYWFSGGPDFGARYWYPILLPCIVLSVRGIQWLTERVHMMEATGWDGTRLSLGIGALILAAVMTFFPWRALDKYLNYRGMRPDIRRMSASIPFGRSIVFIGGHREPDYASAAIYNPLDLKANVPIFVWDRDLDVRKKVLSAYSDRPVWFVDGPTLTGRGFEVVGGPLSLENALGFPHKPLSAANFR